MVLQLLLGVTGLVAILAYLQARRALRRLEQLSQSYWELRYEYTQLRARVARLDPEQPEPEPLSTPENVSFVPLSTLKRS